MLLRCVGRSLGQLSASPELIAQLEKFGSTFAQPPIVAGKEYVAYALEVRDGRIWFYIHDESGLVYPNPYPSPFFELVDARPSRYWILGYDQNGGEKRIELAFPEWTNDPFFHGRLFEGDPAALACFASYKARMDREFSRSGLKSATILEGRWVQCPECSDAWEEASSDGVVECPSCHTLLNNPRQAERT